MFPSSSLCRAQEAYHRNRAAGAELENVRVIATNAAIAWGHEALTAERREERHSRTKVIAGIIALQRLDAPTERDCLFSENPDRGCESP